MARAVVVANTDLPPLDVLRPWLARADLVVALDGAANRLLAAGIEPDVVVGDLDSALGSTRRRLGPARFVRVPEQDRTDLEKGLEYVRGRGARDVVLVGATVARLDHTLASVSLLFRPWDPPVRLRAVDGHFVAEPVRGSLTFRAARGTPVSLWTPSGARGVTTRGLRWPLRGADLAPGTRGVHNEVVTSPVRVRVDAGALLLMRGHRATRHP